VLGWKAVGIKGVQGKIFSAYVKWASSVEGVQGGHDSFQNARVYEEIPLLIC